MPADMTVRPDSPAPRTRVPNQTLQRYESTLTTGAQISNAKPARTARFLGAISDRASSRSERPPDLLHSGPGDSEANVLPLHAAPLGAVGSRHGS